MNATELTNAISNADEPILTEILEERYKRRRQRQYKVTLYKQLSCAAVFAVVILAGVLIYHFSHVTPALPDENPQYVPAFSSPQLEELYHAEPFNLLLPKNIPEGLSLISSYRTEYDPIANPDNRLFLQLCFQSSDKTAELEIQVYPYDGTTAIADPAEPEQYDLKAYDEYRKNTDAVPANYPLLHLFCSDDFSVSIAERRIQSLSDGRFIAQFMLLCGDYVVGYHYIRSNLTAQSVCDLAFSADYFAEK